LGSQLLNQELDFLEGLCRTQTLLDPGHRREQGLWDLLFQYLLRVEPYLLDPGSWDLLFQ
jgi:hypothetical protein